jgi:hypothetical protein
VVEECVVKANTVNEVNAERDRATRTKWEGGGAGGGGGGGTGGEEAFLLTVYRQMTRGAGGGLGIWQRSGGKARDLGP